MMEVEEKGLGEAKMVTQNKYDRQIRLWGKEGQRCLETSNILLLKAGPCGTETLKNLVLPGIGKFRIVDDEKVSESDVANNFFVEKATSMGKPRAEVTCELLNELNPDVTGSCTVASPSEFVKNADSNLSQYSLVIMTEIPEHELLVFEDIFQKLGIPMLIARSMGFIGYLRVLTQTHCVIESKPDPEPAPDIRLADPFPALKDFVTGIDMASLDHKEYKHVPFVVFLVKLCEEWVSDHGKYPSSMSEKKEFKSRIEKLSRKSWGEEENLLEAHKSAYLAFSPRGIDYEVEQILQDPQATTGVCISGNQSDFNVKFWIMVKALKEFVSKHDKKLPLSGVLPDMTATTGMYVDLQKVYREKAEQDAAEIHSSVLETLRQQGRPESFLTKDEIKTFCKNAAHLRVGTISRVADEIDPAKVNKEDLEMAFMEGQSQCPAIYYILIRACDRFHKLHSRYPGENNQLELGGCEGDVDMLHGIVQELLRELKFDTVPDISVAYAREMARYGGVELHNIAAVVGGVASQEAVKLLTHQYTLLDCTYIYNGINCTGGVYKL